MIPSLWRVLGANSPSESPRSDSSHDPLQVPPTLTPHTPVRRAGPQVRPSPLRAARVSEAGDLDVWRKGFLEGGEGPPCRAPLIWMQLEETSQKPCGSCCPGIIPSQQKALG